MKPHNFGGGGFQVVTFSFSNRLLFYFDYENKNLFVLT